MSDSPHEAIAQTGTEKHEQLNIPQTAEPQTQGQQDASVAHHTHLQQPPEAALNRGEDAVDVASQGSMITSDPPSSLMPEED